MSAILDQEKVRRAVEGLADDRPTVVKASTMEILSRGLAAIPALLGAMERREVILRKRAFEALKVIAKDYAPFDYDPDAGTEIRLRQVAYLRARLERR
jgi:hypothetical protein